MWRKTWVPKSYFGLDINWKMFATLASIKKTRKAKPTKTNKRKKQKQIQLRERKKESKAHVIILLSFGKLRFHFHFHIINFPFTFLVYWLSTLVLGRRPYLLSSNWAKTWILFHPSPLLCILAPEMGLVLFEAHINEQKLWRSRPKLKFTWISVPASSLSVESYKI